MMINTEKYNSVLLLLLPIIFDHFLTNPKGHIFGLEIKKLKIGYFSEEEIVSEMVSIFDTDFFFAKMSISL